MYKQPNYISLQITNNVNQAVNATLLGGPFNNSAQGNANTLYEFDLSTETWVGITTLTLIYEIVSTSQQLTVSNPINTLNIAGAVEVLNGFGIGQWYYNGNIIYYYSNDYDPKAIQTT